METRSKSEQKDESEIDTPGRMEDILSSIGLLREETAQISELSELERQYAIETIGYLKRLIEPLNT
ncbi:MAG: hypothetical protein ACREBQ_07885, partial [Nitrososphaerales archaeon]